MAEIKVGASLPKTGRYADSAYVQYSRAYELWISDVNKAGGLLGREVRPVWRDDNGEPDQCAENYRRLIHEDRVDLLLGPCHSIMIEPAAPVAEEAHMLLPEGSGSVTEMFSKGRRFLFLCWGGDRDYMKSFLDFVTGPSSPNRVSKIAVIGGARPRGGGHIDGVRYHAKRLGLEIVFEERVGDPPVDYPDLLRRAYAANPEMLLWDVEARLPDAAGAVPAALAAGFKPSQIWLSDNPTQRGQMPSGMFMRCTWMASDPSPTSQRFVHGFKQAYGIEPEYHSAGGYTCGQVLQQVVTAAGTLDNKVLREAMLKLEFDTVLGQLRYAEDGIPNATFPVAQWQGDKVEMVYPERAKTSEAIFEPVGVR